MFPFSTGNVQKQSCHQYSSIEVDDPSTQVSTEKFKKKCRGAKEGANMNNLKENIEIYINEGNQPIGPNSVNLASLLGVLTREMVQIM